MWIEHGPFGGDRPGDGAPPGVFGARVVIPVADFARLGLGEHERPGALPACFRWCLGTLGLGGSRWAVRLPEGAPATVHFADPAHAVAFLARWAEAPEMRLAA